MEEFHIGEKEEEIKIKQMSEEELMKRIQIMKENMTKLDCIKDI